MLKDKNIYLVPCLGFLVIILVGWILLMLPVCSNGNITPFNAFFTAVSATCVNGLSTVNLSKDYTFLGQIIIAINTEVGAIGFVAFVSFLLNFKKKKMTISETLLLSSALNDDNYGKLKQKLREVIKYTLVIELIGAILLAVDFIPRFGIKDGIWYSIFHSITAFCNAGFDIIGDSSLTIFAKNIYVNMVFIMLMVLGSIGYFVIEDIITCMKKRNFSHIGFNTKIVLTASGIIYVISIILIKIAQPNLTWLETIFTSVAARTTGFTTINMEEILPVTKLLISFLMIIGGAPGSTSGGIRITSIAILVLTVRATLRNKKDIVVYYKKIDLRTIRQAITNICICCLLVLISMFIMEKVQVMRLDNNLFMCASAFSATGLSVTNLASMNFLSKAILTGLMYIGRVGPISILSILILKKKENQNIEYVSGSVML